MKSNTANSVKAVRKFDWLKAYQWKKGQSGNPSGYRPSPLKQFARELIAGMNEEDKLRFLKEINKAEIWRMAEGNPETKEHLEHSGEIKTGESLSAEVISIAKAELKKRKTRE